MANVALGLSLLVIRLLLDAREGGAVSSGRPPLPIVLEERAETSSVASVFTVARPTVHRECLAVYDQLRV